MNRRAEDLIWLDPGKVGVIVDVHDVKVAQDGRMTGTGAQLVVVEAEGGAQRERPLPVTGAQPALELAMMLLVAAACIDADLVTRALSKMQHENALFRAAAAAPAQGTH